MSKQKSHRNRKNASKLPIIIVAVVLVVLIAAGIVIFTQQGDDTAKDDRKIYTALYGSEVSTLNYLTTSNTWDQTVGANVIDTLVEYDSLGNMVPGLAETWTTSEDGLKWTFKLRQGQKWYDYTGKEIAEVTANDFVSALEYVLNPVNESNVAYVVVNAANVLNAKAYNNGEITDFTQVGVKALDDYTVEYTLSVPTPYFASCLTYGCFMPAYGPQLQAEGTAFGTAVDKMYYCGAFIMTEYEPQVKHTYIKNVNNWDAANVHLDGISRIYNAESETLAPQMALRGEVDSAGLSNDIIDDWKLNHPEIITRDRAIPDYSYFYCFNFDPKFDAEYEPDNWLKAVNNANFRHSIMSAFDRTYAMRALEPDDPQSLLQNTVTPSAFTSVNGVDFTALEPFNGIEENFFNTEKALEYKEAAMAELKEQGVTFPVKVLVTYKSGDTDWENESILLKQQLEGVLGTDYIECILYAGPSESFLNATRRAGNYAFMRTNWGADYIDPYTWADPFAITKDKDTGAIVGNSYNKMDLMLDSDYTQTKEILTAYYAQVEEAKAITSDMLDRYNKFAEAEAMLVNNAMLVPYNISAAGYQVTKLNIFEGPYAPFGMSNLRFKYQTLHDDFLTTEEYNKAFEAWREGIAK
ncbi:MAG: peptide ABC transporter substrate-binding protein [Clostridiales bacterium]|nr:peptide ABC transporter substrate-binding protein [Clostridiales bacterium]